MQLSHGCEGTFSFPSARSGDLSLLASGLVPSIDAVQLPGGLEGCRRINQSVEIGCNRDTAPLTSEHNPAIRLSICSLGYMPSEDPPTISYTRDLHPAGCSCGFSSALDRAAIPSTVEFPFADRLSIYFASLSKSRRPISRPESPATDWLLRFATLQLQN
jgi:hypothetical protein